jgi:hypothetical protein
MDETFIFREILDWLGFLSETGPINIFNAHYDAVGSGFVN